MRLVLVEWEDSCGVGSSWGGLPEYSDIDPLVVRSVGWLVVDGEKSKVLVSHLAEARDDLGSERQACGDMTIPSRAVLSITDL